MVNNVVLVRSIPRESLWKEYFGKFRILVLARPKLNNSIDTLPSIKMVEAMAAGKAIIASDIPAMREEPVGSLMLVKPGNPQGFADAMEQLSNDEVLLRSYCDSALSCAQTHDIRKNIKRLIAALEG